MVIKSSYIFVRPSEISGSVVLDYQSAAQLGDLRLVLLSFSVVKLTKHSACSSGPNSGTHIRGEIYVDDKVRRLPGRA